jgi:hypothetical protein
MVLNQDFREFIQSLNDNDVRFLIVGGYAVAFHGHPRYTKDLDIWIWVGEQNAENVIKALDQFGFSSLQLAPADFLDANLVVQLGYPPNRIDLIMGLAGVEFDACYRARVEEEVEGIVMPFIDIENLRKNKKASGRHQDMADLENLQ